MRSRLGLLVLVALAAAALSPRAHADVQVQEKVTFDGFGQAAWGSSLVDTTTRLSGDRLQQETNMKMTGKVMKFVPGLKGSHTAMITRLDKGMLYNVDYEDRTYTEVSLAQMGAATQDAIDQMASQQPPPPSGGEEPPEMTCDPAEFTAKGPGDKKAIAGFDARLYQIEGRQTCRNNETKESCTLSYVLSLWNTPVQGALADLQAFQVKQVKAMGFDMDRMRSQTAAASAFLPGGSAGMEAAMKELGKIEGYPLTTRFEIFADEGCGGAAGGPASGGGAEPASQESSGSSMGSGMKKLFSKFKKKEGGEAGSEEAKKAETATPGFAAPAGKVKLFGMTSEVVSVSTSSVPGESFEVPAGFKKQDWRNPAKG